ncbi:MAG: HEAT repeat domain-containing protein, partial [Planctomycetes bacterium]|nr:HEAT repeat domain-containing protein [Planctomycetota bacterium]
MKRILLACLMLGIIAIWITGDEGKEAKANDEIQSLIKQLGDDDWETREKAKEELTKIGEPALELLKQTLKETQEPEVRMRVEWIIKTI